MVECVRWVGWVFAEVAACVDAGDVEVFVSVVWRFV